MISATSTYGGIDAWSRDNGLFGNFLSSGPLVPQDPRATPMNKSHLGALKFSRDPFAGIGLEDAINSLGKIYGEGEHLAGGLAKRQVVQCERGDGLLISTTPLPVGKKRKRFNSVKEAERTCSVCREVYQKWKKSGVIQDVCLACFEETKLMSKKQISEGKVKKTYGTKTQCGNCNKKKVCATWIKGIESRVCWTCYAHSIPLEKCFLCSKKVLCRYNIEGGQICQYCYNKEFYKMCEGCKMNRICRQYDNNTKGPLCKKCFQERISN